MTAPKTPSERGDGTVQLVTPQRSASGEARFDEQLRLARLAGDHLWIALATHLVADPAAGAAGQLLLDAESVATVHVGCYRCELPWEPRLQKRRCAGDA